MSVSRTAKANLTAAVIAVAIFGLGMMLLGTFRSHPLTGAPLAVQQDGNPALTPVTVPASFPANTIQLPEQKVTAPIDPEGLDAQRFLGIPQDVRRVGWYTGAGPLDGGDPAKGDVVLAGHINYVGQGTGAFGHLYAVKPGEVVITRGTGKPQAWRIKSLADYAKTQGLPQDIFRSDGPRRLTMITCGGTLDSRDGNYLANVVVTAVPVPTKVV